MKFKAYQYPLQDQEGKYYGYYTIKENVKPLGFKGENLTEIFENKEKE